MAIDSCDHGDFIVIYELPINKTCPFCEMESEKDGEIEDLKSQIEDLEADL